MFYGHIALGALITIAIVIFHIVSLVGLAKLLKTLKLSSKSPDKILFILGIIGLATFVIIGIHIIEALAWAIIYFYLQEFNNIEQALYFSIVTSTTLGFGDITLSQNWRLLSAIEAMSGLLLFSLTTAFLIGFIQDLLFHKIEKQSMRKD